MPEHNYSCITPTFENRVAVIKLNRENKLNALNNQLMQELAAALQECEASAEVSAVLIHGSNKAFAAGADIAEMAENNFSENYRTDFLGNWGCVADFSKPVIAAVSGYALGGGLELALACDIIYAANNAKFGQPEITLGIPPGAGGSQRLVRAIGKYKAMEMCLLGGMISAQEAKEFNLVAAVFPEEELLAEALKIAHKISNYSLPAVKMVKEAVNRSFESSLSEGLRFERRLFQAAFALEDQKEGMRAFLAKRPAKFNHR